MAGDKKVNVSMPIPQNQHSAAPATIPLFHYDVMSVTLDATYFGPAVGTFHYNGVTTSDTTVGVERITPNQNFTTQLHVRGGAVDPETPLP